MSAMEVQVVRLLLILNIVNTIYLCKSDDLLASQRYCGLQHIDDYHRNNYEISLDEFPWIAQLLYNKERTVYAVGSLINQRYVLTAAHCLLKKTIEITGVRLGDYDVTTDRDCTNHTTFGEECSDPVQEFDVEELIMHPSYDHSKSANDIGLIRLSRNVEYSEYVRPICLPGSTNFELNQEEQLSVSGWGRVGAVGPETKKKKKLFAKLTFLERCQSIFNKIGKSVNENSLCIVDPTCQGDSGGPLMKSVKNQWYQVGILSFGTVCGNDIPTVYVKVAKYIEWIKTNIRA